ncbi:MAG: sensor domain-containing diguanylate cyclase [bacterium]
MSEKLPTTESGRGSGTGARVLVCVWGVLVVFFAASFIAHRVAVGWIFERLGTATSVESLHSFLESAASSSGLLFLFISLLVFALLLSVSILFVNFILVRPLRRLGETARGILGEEFSRGPAARDAGEIESAAAALEHLDAELLDVRGRLDGLGAVKSKMERINLELNHRLIELYIINEIGSAVSSTLELDGVLKRVMETIHAFLKATDFCILLYNAETGLLEARAHLGFDDEEAARIKFRPGEGVTGQVFVSGVARYVPDVREEKDYKFYHGLRDDVRTFFSVPLVVHGNSIGAINVHKSEVDALTEDERNMFRSVSNQVAIAIDNAFLFEQNRRLSLTDTLTGLHNHGHFQEKLDEEIERARRYRRPLSLLMIDVDHFKRVNDRFGHLRGDAVLREFAHLMRGNLRSVDFSARYGGEEFAAILPETTAPEARIVAERLRNMIEGHAFPLGDSGRTIRTTISVGVSSVGEKIRDKAELIDRADRALYLAKSAGRNRVRI